MSCFATAAVHVCNAGSSRTTHRTPVLHLCWQVTKALADASTLQWPPSLVAAAVLVSARRHQERCVRVMPHRCATVSRCNNNCCDVRPETLNVCDCRAAFLRGRACWQL